MNQESSTGQNKKLIIITATWLIILIGFISYSLITLPELCVELSVDSEGKMLSGGCHLDYSLWVPINLLSTIILFVAYLIIVLVMKIFRKI